VNKIILEIRCTDNGQIKTFILHIRKEACNLPPVDFSRGSGCMLLYKKAFKKLA